MDMGWEGHKSLISLVLGVVIGGLGLIPIMNKLNMIAWKLPDIPETILLILLVVGGAYLMIDGFLEVAMTPSMGWVSILGGIIVALMSILKLLGKYVTMLGFLEGIVLSIIMVIVGFLLFIGAFLF